MVILSRASTGITAPQYGRSTVETSFGVLLMVPLLRQGIRKAAPAIRPQRGSPVRIVSMCIAIYMMLQYLASYTEL